jgi:hypothetical protein
MGISNVRVAGGVAVDDPWLVTGNDAGRFRFTITTATSESLNLQANGGEGYIDLSWHQDDFELMAGFHLYRSTSTNGGFSRINTSVIPPAQRSWRDLSVTPGQTYYYKFTVIKTDLNESEFSNLATAAATDTVPPVITHTPVTSAQPGLPLTLAAEATDNVSVRSVTLYFRPMSTATYTARAMTLVSGTHYTGTIEGSLVTSPGIEYYLEASDARNTTRSGRPEAPYQVTINNQPVITAVSPNQGPVSGGTSVAIGGSNFKPGASLIFGGVPVPASNVVLVSSSQLNCLTPPHFPAAVDVVVSNLDDGVGRALNGFTYLSDAVSLSLPNASGPQQSIAQVPVNVANLNGGAAVSLTVMFNPAVLRARTARAGALIAGCFMAVNTNIAGQVRVSMASSGPTVSGAGLLASLEFDVLGTPHSTTALTLTNVSINDGAIQVQSANGSFTVNEVYAISGTVHYWTGTNLVAGALATAQGVKTYNGTATNGFYTIPGIEPGDYTVSLTKADGINGLTAFDASLVLQHDAGLVTLTGPAAIAADVNKSGQITAFDAYYILQSDPAVSRGRQSMGISTWQPELHWACQQPKQPGFCGHFVRRCFRQLDAVRRGCSAVGTKVAWASSGWNQNADHSPPAGNQHLGAGQVAACGDVWHRPGSEL